MLLFQVNLTPDYDNIKVSFPLSKQYMELNKEKTKSVERPYPCMGLYGQTQDLG